MDVAVSSTRVAIAAAIGLATFSVVFWHLAVLEPSALGFDFTWPWRAARALLAGQNPYAIIRPVGPFPFDDFFNYPLPAALVALPFAFVSAPVAAALFTGLSGALLAFGISRTGYHRLLIFASPLYLNAAFAGQWSALMMAAALLPGLAWVEVCKPTIGFAAFVYRPTRIAVVGGVLLAAVSFALVPTWLGDWIRVVTHPIRHHYIAPVMLPGGFVLLLGVLRWRRPEGRFLAAWACAPQVMGWYTAFALLLVAERKVETWILVGGSLVLYFGYTKQVVEYPQTVHAPLYAWWWVFGCLVLPALVMTLRRPNDAE